MCLLSRTGTINAPSYRKTKMAELFDKFTTATALYDAFQKAKRESHWKDSVQRFGMSILQNVFALKKELRSGEYEQRPCVVFTLRERGKTRLIKSLCIRDRIVQRALCERVLNPIFERSLIYDNGASVKGKGISFTRNRLSAHLRKFVRKHGVSGYILKIDFSKFFDNIDHDLAFEALKKKINDVQVLSTLRAIFCGFRVDASSLSDAEIEALEMQPLNLLTLAPSKEGRKILNRSLGIGSQVSQIIGIYYPTPIDFHCKVKRRCKYYGRYMDDIYIIHENKKFLESVLEEVKALSRELRLFINERKTTITPLKRGFTFLKVKYDILSTGRILKRMCRDSFVRERKRLHVYRRLLDEGKIDRRIASNYYQSYRGQTRRFASHRSLRNLDALYNNLFVEN